MSNILMPKNYIDIPEDRVAVFLLGPIIDAPLWQDVAIRNILSEEPEAVIINPRREVASDLRDLVIVGRQEPRSRQRAWELHYIDLVSNRENGCAMFWLPCATSNTPGHIYAGTTRVEFGEMMKERKYNPKVRFCVGGEMNFPNLDIMAYDLSVYASEKRVIGTLEETCEEAVKLARQSI